MDHVVWLGARGLTLTVVDGRLHVTPSHLITDEIRQRIQEHREEIIAVVTDPDPWRERRELYGRLYRGEEAA